MDAICTRDEEIVKYVNVSVNETWYISTTTTVYRTLTLRYKYLHLYYDVLCVTLPVYFPMLCATCCYDITLLRRIAVNSVMIKSIIY